MAGSLPEICVLLCFLMRITKGITPDCKLHGIQEPIDGQACEQQEYENISATERHHCSFACIYSKGCKATVHDSHHSTCMLLSEPCMLLKPYPNHVYQSFQHTCTKWVPGSDNAPGYWISEGGRRSYIVRKFIDDGLVVGKLTTRFFAVHPSDTSVIEGTYDEKLVVGASCQVTWVWYDATTGGLLPDGALVGGFVVATNTLLYVSRLTVFGNKIVGYYHPLHQRACLVHYGIIRSGTRFEIMVVQPPTAIP